MELRKGNVYYNQEIPTTELWEDTLKRENLRIFQLANPVGTTFLNTFNVTMYKPINGELVIADRGDLSKQEIENLIKVKM